MLPRRSLSAFRGCDVDLVVLDGYDHVAVLIVAEHLSASFPEAFECLGSRVAVGVVRADLDNGYLGSESVQKERGCRGVGAVVVDLENGKGLGVQNGPMTL